jgi:sortase (surface protein transpeptidase)
VDIVNNLRRVAGTYLSRFRGLIVANRYRSILSAIAVLILVGELVANGQATEKADSAAFLAVIPTVTMVPAEVPTIEASPTDVAVAEVAEVASSTPIPATQVVVETSPSPTLVALSTPAITPDATVGALSPTPGIGDNAAAKPAVAETHPGAPITLLIPKIGVKASVESVGTDRTGAMATPSGPYTVGWWDQGTVPGNPGNAVIDGHLDYVKVGTAVFWSLGNLRAGDQILVQMPGNRTLTFVVDRSATYPFDHAPLLAIFGPTSTPSLNLVTCSGSFDRTSKNYNRRLVVYSHLLTS